MHLYVEVWESVQLGPVSKCRVSQGEEGWESEVGFGVVVEPLRAFRGVLGLYRDSAQ